MTAVEKLLSIARNEIGYLEKDTNSNLDSKTENAGHNNYTKYARDLDKTILYNGKKNGYAWCDMFVDWCFIQAFGFDMALKLTCQPTKGYGAGCSYSAKYYKNKDQFHEKNPQPGDQIFFTKNNGTSYYHTGIVEYVKDGRVYTIEGNTSSSAGVVENGGSVEAKSYSLSSKSIGGYGRPDYSLVDKISPAKPKPTTSKIIDAAAKYNPNKSGKVANANVVNVRTGPGTIYSKIGTISKDTEITLLGTDVTKNWLKFKNGTYAEAWISAAYVKVNEIQANTPITGKIVNTNAVNIRTGPGTNYPKIGTLARDSKINIIGASSNNKWYKFKNATYTDAWVSATYVKVEASQTNLNMSGKVNASSLNVRSGPTLNHSVIGHLKNGDNVTIIDMSTDKQWYQIKSDKYSDNSWVSAKYIVINKNTNSNIIPNHKPNMVITKIYKL